MTSPYPCATEGCPGTRLYYLRNGVPTPYTDDPLCPCCRHARLAGRDEWDGLLAALEAERLATLAGEMSRLNNPPHSLHSRKRRGEEDSLPALSLTLPDDTEED